MRKRNGMLIIWPAYFEKNYTRSEGRRVPTNLAAPDVSIKVLEAAAQSSGFDYEIESDKKYARSPSEKKGYLVIENPENHKKKRVLLMLAKGIRRAVAQRESARLEEQRKKKGKGKKKHRK